MIKTVIKILSLDCREATAIRSAYQDEELSRGDRWALAVHMLICGACRKYRDQLKRLRQVFQAAHRLLELEQSLPGLSLTDEAKARIRQRIG